MVLLGLFHPAKRSPRGKTRVLGAHARCPERALEELQMRSDLARARLDVLSLLDGQVDDAAPRTCISSERSRHADGCGAGGHPACRGVRLTAAPALAYYERWQRD